jgi:hypothetical protein
MVDLDILKQSGSTTERLKEILTARKPAVAESATDTDKKASEDSDLRLKIEDRINGRLSEGMTFGLKNFHIYSAVDLAWDAPPITKVTIPLTLYAQGRIDVAACAARLEALQCSGEFVKRNDKNKIIGIDLPKFHDVSINLPRSIITRRLAAQSNKYSNLWPCYRYESRSTSQVGKLRADLISQRADIMADQFGYRHHDTQVMRDALLYGWSVDFLACSWDREIHWRAKQKLEGDTSEVKPEDYVSREGLRWINPHPTRAFWDNAHALATINDDIGCQFLGFWDVVRYGDIAKDSAYWNRSEIGFTSAYVDLFSTYQSYFNQYYCRISVPGVTPSADLSSQNDRRNLVGVYSAEDKDASVVLANYFEKVIPKEIGCGKYPYPVWVRYVVASWSTIIYAEFLPSTPAAYLGVNQKDDRALSIGYGHEILPYQDQLSNLFSYLLLALKADNLKVMVVNTDLLNEKEILELRAQAKGHNYAGETIFLEISAKRIQDLNLDGDKKVIELVETKSSTQINLIFNTILQLLAMVERLLNMSPQEQGQPAPREISAREVTVISGTTESVYSFISDGIDEFRAAKKRMIYESYLQFGERDFRLPVLDRYTAEVIAKAGLHQATDEDSAQEGDLVRATLIGSKTKLIHDYIFTSRDGAERSSNIEGARSIAEVLKSLLAIQAVREKMTKGQLFEILNEFMRKAGDFEVNLDAAGSIDEPLEPSAADQLQDLLTSITERLEAHEQLLKRLTQNAPRTATPSPTQPTIGPFSGSVRPSGAPGPAQAAGATV